MKAIIYYSLSGNTRDIVKDKFEGDFFQIEGKMKIPKRYFFQLAWLGFFSTMSLRLKYKPIEIDLDKYDEIVLASPVWAFTFVPFLKKWLKSNKLEGKKITLLLTHAGGSGRAMRHFKRWTQKNNEIVDTFEIQTGLGYQGANLLKK